MSSAPGRFTSPDTPFADQRLENPQSWNLYNYAHINSLKYIDPDGHQVQLQRIAQQILTRFPQVERNLNRYVKAAMVVGDLASRIASGKVAEEANASTLMSEHPGLSKKNATDIVSAPFGVITKVGGAGTEGADIGYFAEDPDGILAPTQYGAAEVKVSKLNRLDDNLSKAAEQLIKSFGGGTAFIQVPDGTTVDDVLQKLRGSVNIPGRSSKKFENIILEVRDESGKVLYNGPVK
jgi:hypothetical protein